MHPSQMCFDMRIVTTKKFSILVVKPLRFKYQSRVHKQISLFVFRFIRTIAFFFLLNCHNLQGIQVASFNFIRDFLSF